MFKCIVVPNNNIILEDLWYDYIPRIVSDVDKLQNTLVRSFVTKVYISIDVSKQMSNGLRELSDKLNRYHFSFNQFLI